MKTICFKAEKRNRGVFFRLEEDSKQASFDQLKELVKRKQYMAIPSNEFEISIYHEELERAFYALSMVEETQGHGISNLTIVSEQGRTLVEWLDPEKTETHFWIEILIERKESCNVQPRLEKNL